MPRRCLLPIQSRGTHRPGAWHPHRGQDATLRNPLFRSATAHASLFEIPQSQRCAYLPASIRREGVHAAGRPYFHGARQHARAGLCSSRSDRDQPERLPGLTSSRPATPRQLGTLAAKMLAIQFSADLSAADWRRFGRAPGFTNRKPQHRKQSGVFPFTRLISSTGTVFAAAGRFSAGLRDRGREVQRQSILLRTRRCSRRERYGAPTISLQQFRDAALYWKRPAAADMAFSVCAYANGWRLDDIAAALHADYLSRNPDPGRRDTYIRRNLEKARRWAD